MTTSPTHDLTPTRDEALIATAFCAAYMATEGMHDADTWEEAVARIRPWIKAAPDWIKRALSREPEAGPFKEIGEAFEATRDEVLTIRKRLDALECDATATAGQGSATEVTPAPPDAARPKLLTISWGPGAFTGEHFRLRAEAERIYALRLEREVAAARERIAKLEREAVEEAKAKRAVQDGLIAANAKWSEAEQALAAANARAEKAEDGLEGVRKAFKLQAEDSGKEWLRANAAEKREREALSMLSQSAESRVAWVAANNPKALIDAGWVPRSCADTTLTDTVKDGGLSYFDRLAVAQARIDDSVRSWLAAREGGAK